jgi:Helix-turn-helix domain
VISVVGRVSPPIWFDRKVNAIFAGTMPRPRRRKSLPRRSRSLHWQTTWSQGISPRYLQRLFEKSGTSFTAHTNELRLQRAFTLLTGARDDERRICDIALQTGFSVRVSEIRQAVSVDRPAEHNDGSERATSIWTWRNVSRCTGSIEPVFRHCSCPDTQPVRLPGS